MDDRTQEEKDQYFIRIKNSGFLFKVLHYLNYLKLNIFYILYGFFTDSLSILNQFKIMKFFNR